MLFWCCTKRKYSKQKKQMKTFANFNLQSYSDKARQAHLSPHFQNKYHRKTRKKSLKSNVSGSLWQGQEDSNPRPTVLEWMWENGPPPECPLFRRFAGIWKVFLKKSNLIDAFFMLCKYLRALIKSSTLCCKIFPSIQNSADNN